MTHINCLSTPGGYRPACRLLTFLAPGLLSSSQFSTSQNVQNAGIRFWRLQSKVELPNKLGPPNLAHTVYKTCSQWTIHKNCQPRKFDSPRVKKPAKIHFSFRRWTWRKNGSIDFSRFLNKTCPYIVDDAHKINLKIRTREIGFLYFFVFLNLRNS